VIAGGVYNSGILAGGDTFDYLPAPPEVVARVDHLRAVCSRRRVPLPAAAVQFPGRHPAVACALVGCRSVNEVVANAGALEMELPPELWAELDG
jgi:D-threo-aldose 1-dehydrogenase